MFNVLTLETTKPYTINSCFYLKGKKLKQIIGQLAGEICESKNISKFHLSQEITLLLNCERSTIHKILTTKNHFPVYLINILLEMTSEEVRASCSSKISNQVEFFKFGNNGIWVQLPRELTAELAWLCGSIAADGWITRESCGKERLGIVDQNKCALQIARDNFYKIFGLKLNIIRHKRKNCWLLIVDCKALTCFFTTFLGFNYGRKTETVSEPDIIKQSPYRLEFAKGVMAFDGSVELDSTVSIGLKSKNLIEDLGDIFKENNFEFKYSKGSRDCHFLRSKYLTCAKDKAKWVDFFGLNTTKGNRLNFLINNVYNEVNSESQMLLNLENFVRRKPISKVSITEIFNFAKERNVFTKYDLMKKFNIAHATFWKYILILKRARVITCEYKKGRGIPCYYFFNGDVESWNTPIIIS